MSNFSRFDSPSSALTLKSLMKQTRQALCIGLLLSVVIHFAFTQVKALREQQKVSKPLTTQFVKRQPRLTKPLELKKRPQPKQRSIQRKMVTVQARVNRRQVSSVIQPVAVVQSLAKPQASIGRFAGFVPAEMEPEVIAQAVESTKETKNVVDMSLEMMDIRALDTGQYQAMVVQDTQDRRNIRGFFHFAFAYSVTMRFNDPRGTGDDWRPRRAIRRLLDAVNKHTNIQCNLTDEYTYDSRKLFLTPLVPAVTRWAFKLTESEATNLGQYLMQGGFLFIDPIYRAWAMDRPAMPSSYGMPEDALGTQGLKRSVEYDFEKLPNDHPLYHCFFDFDGPPPAADAIIYDNAGQRIVYDYLEGITIDGRLMVVLSKKWYHNAWGDWGTSYPISEYEPFDPERPLQFGVNLIVFVLTQEGSITHQVMDSVTH